MTKDSTSALILAAGKGTRLEPFTKTVPKPLIKIAGKPILYHALKSLYEYVDEYVVVVGYLSEMIVEYFGQEFLGKPIKYVVQDRAMGTGHAVAIAREMVSTEWIIIQYGDDLYDPGTYAHLPAKKNIVVGKEFENWKDFGVLKSNEDGTLDEIVEKPKEFVGNNVNVGVYQVHREFLGYLDQMTLSERGEYELTQAVSTYTKDHPMQIVSTQGYWLSVGYPWHILQAQRYLFGLGMESQNEGVLEEGAVIKGNVQIGKNAVVRSGAYIDGNVIIGANSTVGPNCYIRGNVTIGNNCKIGNAVEIEESVLGDKVNVEHLSFVGYSVVGNNVILGAGTITSDRRHDRESIRVNIKEELKDSQECHLGAFIGDMVRTGIHTSIYPGRKMHYHSYSSPGEVVRQDKLSSEDMELK
jgi:UDP-N-acetylglucosamine diphosphorylase/glucosamine-1-phosphate N-acetyltransferase